MVIILYIIFVGCVFDFVFGVMLEYVFVIVEIVDWVILWVLVDEGNEWVLD